MMFHVNADFMKRIPGHVLVREAWEITVRVGWLHPKDGYFCFKASKGVVSCVRNESPRSN